MFCVRRHFWGNSGYKDSVCLLGSALEERAIRSAISIWKEGVIDKRSKDGTLRLLGIFLSVDNEKWSSPRIHNFFELLDLGDIKMKKILFVVFLSAFAIPSFGMKFELQNKKDDHIAGKKRKRNEKEIPNNKKRKIDFDFDQEIMIPPTIKVIKQFRSDRGSNIIVQNPVQRTVKSFSGQMTYSHIDPSWYFSKILKKKDKEKTARENYLEMRAIEKFGSIKNSCCRVVGEEGSLNERLSRRLEELGDILLDAGVNTLFSTKRQCILYVKSNESRFAVLHYRN